MSRLTEKQAANRAERIKKAINKWYFKWVELVAERQGEQKAMMIKIWVKLNKKYDPLLAACADKQKAAEAALRKLQEESCPNAPHRGMRWCEACNWSWDKK